ncbi:7TM diverse intracellular signaling domain-containing protein [Pseudobacteriovorax antillogorgiicola]|uniref:histidine kinase n=1 Tax=Pseudobacteriovorax antillogorgiicola TaxID=1513793 RepID=A0A1Y6CE03_9BACT|nr:7TM diverse intracellular signaling domain-containing protein [Pseudobacteriovorax antillogorgiicola]TCS47917.1 Hpt domain-containing protein [Pseudobacteriovorax antillogorgiicola]SMF57892.1 Hpt domain-containing protein [Pseudobacteriovorax antillogorgiicola]
MNIVFRCFVCTLVLAELSLAENQSNTPGVLDLRGHDWQKNDLLAISENWHYYDKQLIDSSSLNQASDPETVDAQVVMADVTPGGIDGYGTLHLRVILDAPRQLTFWTAEIFSSHKIIVDDVILSEGGIVGTSATEEVPGQRESLLTFTPKQATFDIFIQNSNFATHRRFSALETYLGLEPAIIKKRKGDIITDAFLVGAIVMMGFYHLILYLLRREERAPLWFGLFCLIIGVRTFVRSNGLWHHHVFETPDIIWSSKVEYMTFGLGVLTFIRFFNLLYNKEVWRWIVQLGVWTSLAFTALALVTSPKIFGQSLPYFQLVVVFILLSVVTALVNVVRKKRDGSLIFLVGFSALGFGVVNDILLSQNSAAINATIVHWGLLGFILSQSAILSKRFAADYRQLRVAEGKIRVLNENLERKVEERTQTIRTIYDNVKTGFLRVDHDGHVLEGFTASCDDLFHKKVESGTSLATILELDPRETEHFSLAITQIFDDMLPEEAALSQVARRYILHHGAVDLEGAVIRDGENSVESILYSVSDAGPVLRAEKEAHLNQCLLKIVREKEAFKSFVIDAEERVDLACSHLKDKDRSHFKMVLHTLKGNFYSFGLEDIGSYIHELESLLHPHVDDVREIQSMLQSFMNKHAEVIGLDGKLHGEKSYALSEGSIALLRDRLEAEKADVKIIKIVDYWLKDIQKVTAFSLLSHFREVVKHLALQLGKEVDFKIIGGDILVDPQLVQNIIHNLIHLVRNALDHGIEFPDERGDKAPVGSLTIKVEQHDDEIRLVVEDDGKGLDQEKIKSKAIGRGLMSQLELDKMNEDEILKLIFDNGFSTRDRVTEISGRGFGMGALLTAVQEIGGDIQVASTRGQGTRFTLKLHQDGMKLKSA